MPLHGPGPKPGWRPTAPLITTGGSSGPVPPLTTGSQENVDLGIESWSRAPSRLAQGMLGAVILLAPQFDPSLQLQAKVFQAVHTAPTSRVVPNVFVSGAPQLADFTQQAVIEAPIPANQGRVPPPTLAPQFDPSQLQAKVFPSTRGSKPTSSTVVSAPPQAYVDSTAVVSPVPGTPPVVSALPALTRGEPERADLGIEGWSRAPSLLNQGIVPPFTRTDPQPDLTQTAKVFAASPTPPATFGNLGAYLRAAPEQIDLGIEAWHRHPAERHVLVVTTGQVPQSILAQPQADTSQLAASVWASAVTPQGSTTSAEYRFGSHALALYGAEALKSKTWPTLRTPPPILTGAVPKSVIVPPQADPTQIAAVVQPSLRTPPTVAPGNTTPAFFLQPQADPTAIQGKVWASVPTPAVITTGLVRPLVLAAAQTPPQLVSTAWASAVTPQGSSTSAEYRFGSHALALHGAESVKSRLFQATPTPPAILGVTVSPVPSVLPQADTSVNPSVVWSVFSPSASVIEPVGKTLRHRRSHRYQDPGYPAVVVREYEGTTDDGLQEWELSELLQETARCRELLSAAEVRLGKADALLRKAVLLRRIAENEARIAEIEEEGDLANILSFLEKT